MPVDRARAAQDEYEYLKRRQQSYQLAFSSPAGQLVMQDLVRFCRANETTFHDDPRKSAALEGRREVWLRIQNHLHLSSDQLLALHSGRQINVITGDNDDDL